MDQGSHTPCGSLAVHKRELDIPKTPTPVARNSWARVNLAGLFLESECQKCTRSLKQSRGATKQAEFCLLFPCDFMETPRRFQGCPHNPPCNCRCALGWGRWVPCSTCRCGTASEMAFARDDFQSGLVPQLTKADSWISF